MIPHKLKAGPSTLIYVQDLLWNIIAIKYVLLWKIRMLRVDLESWSLTFRLEVLEMIYPIFDRVLVQSK